MLCEHEVFLKLDKFNAMDKKSIVILYLLSS